MLTITNIKILLLILFFGYSSAYLQSSLKENSISVFDYSLTYTEIDQNPTNKLFSTKDGFLTDHQKTNGGIMLDLWSAQPISSPTSCELWQYFFNSRIVILPNRSRGALGVKFSVKINPKAKSSSVTTKEIRP